MIIIRHEFEDEDGNEIAPEDLTEITYEILQSWVDRADTDIVFTHRIKIRPEAIDIRLQLGLDS